MADWIITIPLRIEWGEYEKELEKVRDGKEEMLYKLSFRPTATPGDRCFVSHRNLVRGWMRVVDVRHVEGFRCTTTGKFWPKAYYIVRSGPFHYIDQWIPMKGFRGIRRFDTSMFGASMADKSRAQEEIG